MLEILALGLIVGMQHALESDHVAAVSSLATGETTRRRILAHGLFWGVGHSTTLLVVAGGALWLGSRIDARFLAGLEFAVGAMLVGLGGQVLYRLLRDRQHFHIHRHGDGTVHLHAHHHRGESDAHDPGRHHHQHPQGLPLRTLAVGLMHGLAGSGALLVLAATRLGSPAAGLAYIALFGVGSIAGMAVLSGAISVPLSLGARGWTRLRGTLEAAIGSVTTGLGLWIMAENGPAIWWG